MSANETSFYLIAAPANSSTCANPCKYIIRRLDTATISVAQVQDMTFKLCHMYFNWQGIIRVPAPIMYASKLNEYAKDFYTNTEIHTELAKKLFFL